MIECPSTFACPPFDAPVETRVTDSSHDVATVDADGQHPNLADQLSAAGAVLTLPQWEALAVQPNPSWEPTYTRVVVDEVGHGVEHRVSVCPACGTPVKVG